MVRFVVVWMRVEKCGLCRCEKSARVLGSDFMNANPSFTSVESSSFCMLFRSAMVIWGRCRELLLRCVEVDAIEFSRTLDFTKFGIAIVHQLGRNLSQRATIF
jgi:hypothetical protein